MSDEARYRAAESRLWASEGLTPTEQRVHLRRNDVDVRLQEVGDGVPALFIHGASNSGTSWAPLVARLSGLRCILLDRPGCGLSDPIGEFADVEALRSYADTLAVDVLDALDIERAHVVATSFGGYVGVRSAAAHPERVRRLLLFGWVAGAPVANMSWFMRLAGVRWLARLGTAVPPSERTVRAMLRRIGVAEALQSGGFSDEAVAAYLALLRDTDTMRNELVSGSGRFMTLRGLDERLMFTETLLRTVRAPTYFLWGENDPFGGPDGGRWMVAHLPDAALEIMPGAGHAVWMDDAGHAARTTMSFLVNRD